MKVKVTLPAKLQKIFDQPLIKGFGLPVLLIILSFILLLFAVRPAVGKVKSLRREQVVVQQSLSALTAKVEQLESFASQAEALDGEFKRFDQAVPSESNVPTLLTQTQAIATTSGVSITAMQFGGEGGVAAGTVETGQLWSSEVRVKLVVEGSFDNVVKLLQTLESASRLIDVETLSYSTQTGAEGGGAVLAAELTLVSYYTAKPVLLPETPLTFSFTDPSFVLYAQVLLRLTPYETQIP